MGWLSRWPAKEQALMDSAAGRRTLYVAIP